MQKAQVVALVKKTGAITLGIFLASMHAHDPTSAFSAIVGGWMT